MARIERPIFFDADSLIRLWEYGEAYYDRLFSALQDNAYISQEVKNEFKGAKDYATGRWRSFPSYKITSTSTPRLLTTDDLTEDQYKLFLSFFSMINMADPGERETFSMAWVLEYDVCSEDTEAWDIFNEYKPTNSSSQHRTILQLLRHFKII